jgi:hypothetical protein
MTATEKTTRVRLMTSIAGSEPELRNFAFGEGKVVDLPASLAAKWCASGIAIAAPNAKAEAEIKAFKESQ